MSSPGDWDPLTDPMPPHGPSSGAETESRSSSRYVRPYTITAGRTKTTVDLPLEATLTREPTGERAGGLPVQRILEVCHQRSVAEVAALCSLPVGVVRVLLGDLIDQGVVRLQTTITENSSHDERIELIERTLRGLRTY